MSDELVLKLSELYRVIGRWNSHFYANEELFLNDLMPLAKKVCEELDKEKDDSESKEN